MTREQDEFIEYSEGDSLLTAIPGSGKTTTSVKKIAAVLGCGRSIIAMSFTKEAAKELKEKALAKLDPDAARRCQVGTFHSMALRSLLELRPSPLLGLRPIREGEASSFKAIALKNAGLDASHDAILRLDLIRSCTTDPFGLDAARALQLNDLSRQTKIDEAERWSDAVTQYEASLRRDGLYDFAGLLKLGLDVVQSGTRLLVADEILVDEFQDVDEVQLRIILAHRQWSVIHVVGDDDQSIYKFRAGLGYGALQTFLSETGAKEMTLSLCFRCRAEILIWAQDVIEQNVARSAKRLTAARGSGGRIQVIRCRNEGCENELVARLAKKTLSEGAKTVAIIARTNKSLLEIQPALTGVVEFECVGCGSFWDLEPCAAALGLLRSVAAPTIEMAGLEVAVYWFGASERDIDALRQAAKTESIAVAFGQFKEDGDLSDDGLKAIETIQGILAELSYPFTRTRQPVEVDIIVEIVFGHLRSRLESNFKLSNSAANTQRKILDAAMDVLLRLEGSLAQRLAVIELTADKAGDAAVKLMTMHGSKGREFDSVFLIRTVDEVIPGDAEAADLEEERRLLYVGMTRARDALTVTYPRERSNSRWSRPSSLTRLLAVEHTPLEEYDDEYDWLFQEAW